jgi:hypothetical protein
MHRGHVTVPWTVLTLAQELLRLGKMDLATTCWSWR